MISAALVFTALTQDCGLPDLSTVEKEIAITLLSGDNPSLPTIRIIGDVQYVCLASGMYKNMYRGTSLLVNYECNSSSQCPSTSAETSQFEFFCSNTGKWSARGYEHSFMRHPIANSATSLRTDCSYCFSPLQAEIIGLLSEPDNSTHCIGI